MRVGALSASLADIRPVGRRENTVPESNAVPAAVGWNEQAFAEEQIRGLVRQVFSSALNPRVQQVVFAPVERETDVWNLCLCVGEVLAQERHSEIAVIDESEIRSEWCSSGDADTQRYRTTSVRQLGERVRKNLWSFPVRGTTPDPSERMSLSNFLSEVRREFEYSIVAAPPPTISSKVLDLAMCADGLVLVLSAQRTRRVTALKVRNTLGAVRLLGTVLSEREFPIPTSLYRRL
jgi:hypothetical protein